MKMHDYNRGLDLRQIYFLQNEQQANRAIASVELADLSRDIAQLNANARLYSSDAGYLMAKMGRLTLLARSRIREIEGLRTAERGLGLAEKGLADREIATERAVLAAQQSLYTQQAADFATALTMGQRVGTAQRNQVTAERAALVARGGTIDARERMRLAQRARIGAERTALGEELDVASAQRTYVGTQRAGLEGTTQARLGTLMAGREVLGGRAELHALGATQRLRGREQQLRQEVGALEASGAARGLTGSFQAVRTAAAEQRAADDVARFRAEDEVAELELAQQEAKLGEELVTTVRGALSEQARLGVAGAQVDLAIARATATGKGLDVQAREQGVEQARIVEERARLTAAHRTLGVKQAQIDETQESLRARTSQGRAEVAVREAGRAGAVATLADKTAVAAGRQALVQAQYTAGGERVTRENIEHREAQARTGQERLRSLNEAAQQTRQAGRVAVKQAGIRQEVWLSNIATSVAQWQASNLPSADEYKSTGRQSDTALILSGIAGIVSGW